MLVIALTGGIGAGKSTVADRFAELGVPVIDADILAREQVRSGSEGLQEIARSFGPGVLTDDGELDRRRLRQLVFDNPTARRRLEGILHPRIRAQMRERITRTDAPYVVLVIPLLVENAQADLADRILVVDAPEALQIERASRRDHQSHAQIRAVLEAQCSREERNALADDLIINDGSLQELLDKATALHNRYMSLVRDKKNI